MSYGLVVSNIYVNTARERTPQHQTGSLDVRDLLFWDEMPLVHFLPFSVSLSIRGVIHAGKGSILGAQKKSIIGRPCKKAGFSNM